MDKKYYEMYINYKIKKDDIIDNHTVKMKNDILELEESLGDNLVNIRKVEGIVKGAKSLGFILTEIFAILIFSLFGWLPLIMYSSASTLMSYWMCLGITILVQLMIIYLVYICIYQDIQNYLKYKKLTKV